MNGHCIFFAMEKMRKYCILDSCCEVPRYIQGSAVYLANAHFAPSKCLRVKPHGLWVQLWFASAWCSANAGPGSQGCASAFSLQENWVLLWPRGVVSRRRVLRIKAKNGSSCKVGVCASKHERETTCSCEMRRSWFIRALHVLSNLM